MNEILKNEIWNEQGENSNNEFLEILIDFLKLKLKEFIDLIELTSSFANSFTLFQELLKNIKFHLISFQNQSIN